MMRILTWSNVGTSRSKLTEIKTETNVIVCAQDMSSWTLLIWSSDLTISTWLVPTANMPVSFYNLGTVSIPSLSLCLFVTDVTDICGRCELRLETATFAAHHLPGLMSRVDSRANGGGRGSRLTGCVSLLSVRSWCWREFNLGLLSGRIRLPAEMHCGDDVLYY